MIAVVTLVAAAICWAIAPNWYHPITGPGDALAQRVADEASRRTTVSATRAAIATAVLGVGALLAVWINNANARAAIINARAAADNANAATSNARVATETLRVTERGHLTDRYAKAVGQLGENDNDTARLGGIYSLQQYAQDSDRAGDQRTVVEVLSAFIRDKLAGVGGSDGTHHPPGADVLAAVGVLAQLLPREGVVRAYIPGALFHSVDISDARLVGGNLSGVRMDAVLIRCADLTGINLDGANFDNASLIRCNLTGASLRKTIFRTGALPRCTLHGADLEGADLGTVNFEEAEFTGANMRSANLGNANLTWTDLSGVNLSGAHCLMADFRGANLDGANLDGAQLEDGQLTAKQIESAKNVPPGLKPKNEAQGRCARSEGTP